MPRVRLLQVAHSVQQQGCLQSQVVNEMQQDEQKPPRCCPLQQHQLAQHLVLMLGRCILPVWVRRAGTLVSSTHTHSQCNNNSKHLLTTQSPVS